MRRTAFVLTLGIAMGRLAAVSAFADGGQSSAHSETDRVERVLDRDVVVREVNRDKSKIAPYGLEDPLRFLDGRKVTAENWAERRREILWIFAREVYGAEPPAPETVEIERFDEGVSAAGFAIRRQYRMWFRKDRTGPCINWVIWLPRFAKKPVPVISFLNYCGNHELAPDPEIPVTDAWLMTWPKTAGITDHKANPSNRGIQQNPNWYTVLPLGMILARGYAVMSACYAEVSRDDPTADAFDGVFGLWGRRDPDRTDNIAALGAWAWAISRGLDLAERIPEIDARRSVVTGYSRLAKAALVAAARDERFAVCVPVQTGGGGCRLSKRNFGENVSASNRICPHWYCTAYAKYAADPAKLLTFDQHLFMACVAPRALLVEGYDCYWFDTEGEYLAVRAASPVWELLGQRGLPGDRWPDDFDTSAIGERIGYVRRSEEHGIAACDWAWMLDFADRALAGDPAAGRAPAGACDLQAKIDQVSGSGGGTVRVPRGDYPVAFLELKSNVRLELEEGARLYAETNALMSRARGFQHEHDQDMAMVIASGATNIAIVGKGVIDGLGRLATPIVNNRPGRWKIMDLRDSKGILLEGISIRDSASWTCYFRRCEDVVCRGVKIDGHANYNNDGFDIEARNVLIEDCDIDSEDDCICGKIHDPNFVSENVEVRNCRLASNCNFIKMGTASHGVFRKWHVHDIVLKRCRCAPLDDLNWKKRRIPGVDDDTTGLAGIALEVVDGGAIEDVLIERIEMNDAAQTPIFCRVGARSGKVVRDWNFRNVTIRDVRASACSWIASSLTGVPSRRLGGGVLLKDIDLTVKGGLTGDAWRNPVPERERNYPENRMFGTPLPAYGFYLRHADGVRFENVKVRVDGTDPRPEYVRDDCH